MFGNEEYEALYSPSRWSKRFNSEEVIVKHIEFLNDHSKKVQRIIPCKLNQPYGPGQRDVYDTFGTDLGDDSPILIHIHGGYYQEGTITHSNNSFIARAMHKNGIKTILVGYELSPKRTVEEILKYMQIGLRKCIHYALSLNSRGIYLSGHSAGAHAIASILTEFGKSLQEDRNIIKAVFLISGIYDTVPLTKTSINKLLNLSEEKAKGKLSPLYNNLEYGSTKIYVIAGENDSPSFIKQAKQFFNKLQAKSVKSQLNVIPIVDHFDIIENLYLEDFELTRLIIHAIKVS